MKSNDRCIPESGTVAEVAGLRDTMSLSLACDSAREMFGPGQSGTPLDDEERLRRLFVEE